MKSPCSGYCRGDPQISPAWQGPRLHPHWPGRTGCVIIQSVFAECLLCVAHGPWPWEVCCLSVRLSSLRPGTSSLPGRLLTSTFSFLSSHWKPCVLLTPGLVGRPCLLPTSSQPPLLFRSALLTPSHTPHHPIPSLVGWSNCSVREVMRRPQSVCETLTKHRKPGLIRSRASTPQTQVQRRGSGGVQQGLASGLEVAPSTVTLRGRSHVRAPWGPLVRAPILIMRLYL